MYDMGEAKSLVSDHGTPEPCDRTREKRPSNRTIILCVISQCIAHRVSCDEPVQVSFSRISVLTRVHGRIASGHIHTLDPALKRVEIIQPLHFILSQLDSGKRAMQIIELSGILIKYGAIVRREGTLQPVICIVGVALGDLIQLSWLVA